MGLMASMVPALSMGSAVLGLFGHHGAGQANQFMSDEADALQGQRTLAGQYGNIGSQQMGNYNADNSQYRNAAGNYANYLSQNPYSDQRSAAAIASGTSGMSDAYNRARANLQSGLSGSGMGGGYSAGLGGGLAGIESGAAGTLGAAQNQLMNQKLALIPQNMQALTNLYGGMAGQDYGNGMGAMGAQGSMLGNVAQGYGQLGDQAIGMTNATNAAANGLISGGLGTLGSYEGYQQGMKGLAGMYGMPSGLGGAGGIAGLGSVGGTGYGLPMGLGDPTLGGWQGDLATGGF